MLRTHTCGELNRQHIGQKVSLCGWVQTIRDKGGVIWVDLRDRYGVVQLISEQGQSVFQIFKGLGREYVVRVEGEVVLRKRANPDIATGDIEVRPYNLKVLNKAKTPPFVIEDESDGGAVLRMKYRYLALRQKALQAKLKLKHEVAKYIRAYLDEHSFMEVETPMLIKSTPEGAKDFVVPVGSGAKRSYYALPQSPQTLKQLLMIGGIDRYYQLVKCFRNEDLRADRQPEFTQVDCELSFVEQEDVLRIFEGLIHNLFLKFKQVDLPEFVRMSYAEAMQTYGSDKPDLRWGMPFVDFTPLAKGKEFKVFDEAEAILGICLKKGATLSRKALDGLIDFVRRPEVGAKGLVYVKYGADGTLNSSVQKWYSQACIEGWLKEAGAEPGDMLLMLSGDKERTRVALSTLRLEVGKRYCSHLADKVIALWVVDFPLLAWCEEEGRYHALHHPFTAPRSEDYGLLASHPSEVRGQSYDMVINGMEVGGGSIRVHDRTMQLELFKVLGFAEEQAKGKFGFLFEALSYGTPPHGGIAIGFDRLCMILEGGVSIREYIAFPKNNAGRDMMLGAPSELSDEELKSLGLV